VDVFQTHLQGLKLEDALMSDLNTKIADARAAKQGAVQQIPLSDLLDKLEPLVQDLASATEKTREAALSRLWDFGPQAAPARVAIARTIGDPNDEIAYTAFRLFEQLRPSLGEVNRKLWARLISSEHRIRLAAAGDLVRILTDEMARGDWPARSMEGTLINSFADDLAALPRGFSGKWLAWDDEHRTVLAAADTFRGLLRVLEEKGLGDPVIERAPWILAEVAKRSAAPFPGETADLLADVHVTIPNAEEWLDTPNARLWCERPRDLIHTPKEEFVRSLLRGIRSGITS
jgi:hypothetical protein